MAYPTLADFTSGALHAHAERHAGGQPDDDCDICTLYIFFATIIDHMAPRGLDTPLTGFRFPELQGELAHSRPDPPRVDIVKDAAEFQATLDTITRLLAAKYLDQQESVIKHGNPLGGKTTQTSRDWPLMEED